MKDDKSGPDSDDDKDILDKYDDAVIAADDTGMLAAEKMITLAEIAEAQANDSPKR
jgi:hypothetical protein